MKKSQVEIDHENHHIQMVQVRNLSDVYGFELAVSGGYGKCLILCGQKRRWGNSYKRFAIPSSMETLFGDIKQILAGGGKIFRIQ